MPENCGKEQCRPYSATLLPTTRVGKAYGGWVKIGWGDKRVHAHNTAMLSTWVDNEQHHMPDCQTALSKKV